MDDPLYPPRPTPTVLKEVAQDKVDYFDQNLIRESLDRVVFFETHLAQERRRLVDLRNRRAEWARLLKG